MKPKIKATRWSMELEKKVAKEWTKEKLYTFNPKGKTFVIDTPPPYPSGRPWHIGAAAHFSQIDMIARTARMLGHETFFPIGIDRNGIGVERYTEKKYNISIHDTPREKFLELAKHALDDLEAEMIRTMKAMGMSGDFDNYYRTDSEEYRKLTQATFIDLWNRGLVYEDTRPNNYCIDCGTTIADAEIVYEDRPSKLVYIKFKVKGGGEILIATTRPELLCACQMILVNPEDTRYKHLHGKHAIIPLFNREVEIIPHKIVKMDFGSGVDMVCSYGDYNDVRLFRELKLEEIIAIDMQGRMTKNAGEYAGMTTKEARQKIIEDLADAVVRIEEIMHRTPTCEKSSTVIEIIPMNDFYLRQMNFVDDMRKYAEKMKFHPEVHRQILLDWIDSISIDWPISRRRFYATEIPIWYCKDCREIHVPKSGKYYQPWKDKAPFTKCKRCGSKKFIGEDRTFDTWFDSSISPLFISEYMTDKQFHKKTYPNTLRPQGKDIVRTWLYYSLLRCYQVTGEFPFKHAWIMGYAVDEKGEKMSKSKGNVIDPIPILEKYGADMFRFWNAAEVSLGSDFRVSEQRILSAGKFLTKLWNISRFISMFPVPKKLRLTKTDQWILGELTKLINECMGGYTDFNFFIPSNKVREFVWNVFADHYVEMVKARAYGEGFSKAEQQSAWFTLHTCLQNIVTLLAPIMPFMTDYVSRELYKSSVHEKEFPKSKWESTKFTDKILDFNSQVWNEKKKHGLSLKDEIETDIPKGLKVFAKDLKAMHHIH